MVIRLLSFQNLSIFVSFIKKVTGFVSPVFIFYCSVNSTNDRCINSSFPCSSDFPYMTAKLLPKSYFTYRCMKNSSWSVVKFGFCLLSLYFSGTLSLTAFLATLHQFCLHRILCAQLHILNHGTHISK